MFTALNTKIKEVFNFFRRIKYSGDKLKFYPECYDVESGKTDISHIRLSDDYPDASFVINLYNLDPEKVVFLIDPEMKKQPVIDYDSPIAVLLGKNSLNYDRLYISTLFSNPNIFTYGISYNAIKDINIFPTDIVSIKRDSFIFSDIPTLNVLLFSIFNLSDSRKIPESLYKYMLKLNIYDKGNPIWNHYLLQRKDVRKSIKSDREYFLDLLKSSYDVTRIYPRVPDDAEGAFDWAKAEREEKEGVLTIKLNKNKFFGGLSRKFFDFKKIWEDEKIRDKFIRDNNLYEWFREVFGVDYFYYSSDYYDDNGFEDKYALNDTYYEFIAYIEDLNKSFLDKLENNLSDSVKYPNCSNEITFYKIVSFLDRLDDDEIICFVNFNSEKSLVDQVDINATKLIIKLATVDTKNSEVKLLIDQTNITKKVFDLINNDLNEDIDVLYVWYLKNSLILWLVSFYLFSLLFMFLNV